MTTRNARSHNRDRRRTSRIAASLAAVMAIALLPMSPAAGDDETDLLTPVSVSSSSNTEQTTALYDGDFGTRWISAVGNGDLTPWVVYDLGQGYTLDEVRAYWEGAYATRYLIVGWDGANWQPLIRVTPTSAETPAVLTDFANNDSPYRYVGLVAEARFNGDWGVSLWELEMYGSTPVALDQAFPGVEPTNYVGAPRVPDGATNLALNGTARASSSGGGFAPGNAIDGDMSTRWQALDGDVNESITIDLGGIATISALTVDPEASYARAFTVETSLNGWGDWTTFAQVTGASAEHTVVVPDDGPVNTRYVRLTVDERAMIHGASFYEIGVWGDEDSFVPAPPEPGEGEGVGQLLSYGKTIHTPHFESGYLPEYLTDDDLTTRWAVDPAQTWQLGSAWDEHAWVVIDLEAEPETLEQVSLRWNPAHGQAYNLYVASSDSMPAVSDLSQWTQIYGTTSGTGGRDTITLPSSSPTGRWLLIDMVRPGPAGDGNRYGYSLWEVRVFGEPGSDFPINERPADPNRDATDPDFNNLQVVWEETFDGEPGVLPDADNWTLDPGAAGENNAELQAYTTSTDNIALDGSGNLVITALEDGAGGYTSGRLNTSRKMHAQYGRIEARIQVPSGQGMWPAFWMMGENFLTGTPWPDNGEIDVMEVIGHQPDVLHNTIHGPGYNGANGVGGSHHPGADLSEDFHVYGVDWDSRGMRYWLDDPANVVRTIDRTHVEDNLGAWVFDQPFFLILNLAVGGDWPGSPDATTQFPAQMLVDYVRVSQSVGDGQLITEGFDADPRIPEMTITAPSQLPYGTPAQAQVNVTSPNNTAPSGNLEISVAGVDFELPLQHGNASFALPADLTPGEYELTVRYSDPSFALHPVTQTHSFIVTKAIPEVEVDLGPPTLAEIEPIVAVVRIRLGGAAFAVGEVTVNLGDEVVGTVVLEADDYGVAVLRLPPRATTGEVAATITFAGNDNVNGFEVVTVHEAVAFSAGGGNSTGSGNGGGGTGGTGTGDNSGGGSGATNGTGSGNGPATGTSSDELSLTGSGAGSMILVTATLAALLGLGALGAVRRRNLIQ